MDWKGRRKSSNVEDRRGLSSGKMVVGGIGGIILLLVITLLGGNPGDIISNMQYTDTEVDSSYQATTEEEELAEFASVVLAETEEVWTMLFKEQNEQYDYPTLVLFSGMVDSACGVAGSSTGPFYCPGDQKVYIDLSFFDELRKNYNVPGDFAIAYVVAHEVGHHVQMLLGIMDQLNELRLNLSKTKYNELMVRLELQADYFSGVWAHYINRIDLLEEGDLEEALNAASAVGDDRLQKQNQGYVVPDSFTHGTSEQRQRWFYKGFTNGTIAGGDTFSMDIN